MKKPFLILFTLLLLSGCATAPSRLENYKNQNTNSVKVEISYDIPTTKQIVKEAIKEVNLVERTNLEKDNFIFANTGYGNYLKTSFLSPRYIRIGFFFESNQTNNSTIITISEEGMKQLLANNEPIRYALIDKIKLKSFNYLSKNK